MMIKKLFILLTLLFLISCGGATSSTGIGTSSLEGAPIDIPLPLAKGISSVDPGSLAFVGIDTETADNIGTVTGTASDETSTQSLVVIYDGEVKQTITVTGNFEITLPLEIESKPVAVSVCVGSCSLIAEPVYFKVGPVNPILGTRTFAVFLTNASSDMPETTRAYSIQPNGLVFSQNGLYMSALNSESNPVLVSIDSNGLFSDSPVELDELLYNLTEIDSQDAIAGFDNSDNILNLVNNDGTVTTIDTGNNLPDNRPLAVSPLGSLLATSVYEDEFNPTNQEMLIIDLDTEDQYHADLGASQNITALKIEWLTNSVLFVATQQEDGSTEAFQVDISDTNNIISNSMSAFFGLSANDLADNAKMLYMASHGEYLYQCIPSGESFVGLCSLEAQAPFEDHVLINIGYDVVDFSLDDAETHIIAEIDMGDASADDNVLAFIPIGSDDTYDVNYLSLGTENIYNDEDNGFYSLYPVLNFYQIGFTSTENYLLPHATTVSYAGAVLTHDTEKYYDAWTGLNVDVATSDNFGVNFENLPNNVTEICIECSSDDVNLDFDTPHEMGCAAPVENAITLNNDVFSDANTFSANCLASDTVLYRAKITAGDNTTYSATFYVTTTVANP